MLSLSVYTSFYCNILHTMKLHLFLIFISTNLHSFVFSENTSFSDCSQPFNCGPIRNLTYPFWGDNRPSYCGLPEFKLHCIDHHLPIITISSQKYVILNVIPEERKLRIARADYYDGICPSAFKNSTYFDSTFFEFASPPSYLTLFYGCPSPSLLPLDATPHSFCKINGTQMNVFFSYGEYFPYSNGDNNSENVSSSREVRGDLDATTSSIPRPVPRDPHKQLSPNKGCKYAVEVPILETQAARQGATMATVGEALHEGFELKWKMDEFQCRNCTNSGGECGWNSIQKAFTCFCPERSSTNGSKCLTRTGATPNKKHRLSRHALTKSQTAVLASFSALATCMLVILFIYFTRRNSKDNIVLEVSRPKSKQEVEAFLRNCGITNPKRYSYTELKAITNSFKDTLGEGGYGTVYRGRLHNGNLVAVKILKKPKGDPMEFINEVASIGTTNHKNIVTLVGFCYEGHKRALVYDFMPNGSLEKFVYDVNNHQSLAWEKLFQIAVGVARGLEYLHQGCKTRILHFDIKPHNILLDENFCPKISDFGLAKSCPQKDSIISMSGARGTVGYIAPEVFLRSFGGVSQKSDVYSYGMLVLEMVGSRKNSDVKVEHGSEDYFPDWIYGQLEQQEELDYLETLNDEDRQLWRKMVLVSLWCTQTSPQSRPTMTRVVEMLEGATESLQVPPIPILASPPRSISLQDSSTSHTISIS